MITCTGAVGAGGARQEQPKGTQRDASPIQEVKPDPEQPPLLLPYASFSMPFASFSVTVMLCAFFAC
jgi:hypothetical protein